MNKELVVLRSFSSAMALGLLLFGFAAFKSTDKHRFREIDVERINIIEADGTVKMVITNVERFPAGKDTINNRPTNVGRKKRAGMLFFNEDGIECGGLIYDGQKKENGHSSGLSLTYDQYDGDQVMQLLLEDYKEGDKRMVGGSLVFNDRAVNETQESQSRIIEELTELRKNDVAAYRKKYAEYESQGLIGVAPRVMLGKARESSGLYLFDTKGRPKAMFYVDNDNNARLDFYDDKGAVSHSFPEALQK
jgi:hypothetical protein